VGLGSRLLSSTDRGFLDKEQEDRREDTKALYESFDDFFFEGPLELFFGDPRKRR
jgi:hypothetical protein